MHTYIQVIYDIDTCLITVPFRCHVVYWSIVIIRHGFSGAPLSLQPFLDDVPLFHDISEEFPPIKGTFHPTKLSRLSIYIYIPLEHPSFFARKQGYSDWTHGNFPVGHRIVRRMNSDRWVLTRNPAPCSHPDSSGAKRGGEMLKSSWILGTLVGEMLRLYLQ